MSAPYSMSYLRGLLEHGSPTETQKKAIEAVIEHGNQREAAIALGCCQSAVAAHVTHVKRKAARAGFAPDHGWISPQPEGFHVKGVSTLTRDAEGNPQWVKADADRQQQERIAREAVRALKDDIPRARPESPPKHVMDDLCACYVLSDAHIGMLAWSEETRDSDWDTGIAEDMIVRWLYAALKAAPKAHTGVLAQLGDLTHWDGLEAITPASHHVLDADTRFQRLVRIAIRVIRRLISLMLRKHQHVHVILAEGNHDPASSAWMRELFSALYEDEPRVTVETSPDPYYCFEWGETALFLHHGHKARVAEVSKIFAGKFPETYGRTKYRYAHLGHLHSVAAKEDPLMIVEQHPTLAAMDAYASRAGYLSQRGASVITYSKAHGEVGRTTIRPEAVA